MDRKSILPDVASIVTLIKDTPEAALILTGAITGGLSKAAIIPAGFALPSVGVVLLGGMYRYRAKLLLSIKRALRILRKSDELVKPSDYETIYNKVTIDISTNGKYATFRQQRLVKCLKAFVAKYQYRFFPALKYQKVKHNIGNVNIVPDNQEGTDIFVDLEPLEVNEQQLFELTCKIVEVFNFGDDFWCYSKYYGGKEDYSLDIRFPKSRIPRNYKAEIIDRATGKIVKKCKPRLTITNKKPTLVLNEKNLEDGQDIKLYFTW